MNMQTHFFVIALSLSPVLAACAADASAADQDIEQTRSALGCTPGLDKTCPPKPSGGSTTPPPSPSGKPLVPKQTPPSDDALGDRDTYGSCIADCLAELSDDPKGSGAFANTAAQCQFECGTLAGGSPKRTGDTTNHPKL